jgi:signal transduction histidine kinase
VKLERAPARRRAVSARRRIVETTVAVALVAVFTLGVPLAYLSSAFVRDDARTRLERDADKVLVELENQLALGQLPHSADLLRAVEPELMARIEMPGKPPIVVNQFKPGQRVLTASATDKLGNVVTLSRDAGPVIDRMQAAVGVVMLVSLVALGSAIALATVGGKRLARPLAALAQHASQLGAGQVTSKAPRAGLVEIDAVAEVLDRSAARIGAMLESEREFTANASHQLRTPLTALRLRLESLMWDGDDDDTWQPAVKAALAEADRLEATIDALLALARTGRAGPAASFDLAGAVRLEGRQWLGPLAEAGRRVQVHVPDQTGAMTAFASPAAVSEALDVLLENSLRHGRGLITLSLRRSGLYGVVAVEDEGPGIQPGHETAIFERGRSQRGTGIGLALARSLIEADGGRLELAAPERARFELYVPLAE